MGRSLRVGAARNRFARIVVGVGCTLLIGAACAPNGSGADADVPPLLSSFQVYTAADSVHFVLLVTNTTESAIELSFRDGQTFDFIVTSGSGEVWRWSEEQMFIQALQTDRMGPGESRRYEAAWRPPDGVGGEYLATGRLTSSSHPIEQSTQIVLP